MAAVRPLTDRQVRLIRQAGQLLHRPRGRTVDDIVRHLVGLQAQDRAAFPLAVRARSARASAREVESALVEERSIVRAWAMRGTLHLLAAEDHGWLTPLVGQPVLGTVRRRLAQLGVERPDRGVQLIERMLAGGPMTRPEIAERLANGGIRAEGQGVVNLLLFAAVQGIICDGPPRGKALTHVLAREWVGPPQVREREAALRELATRYLRAHGPAAPVDFRTWSGLRMRDVRDAWRSIGDGMVEVGTRSGPMWMLRRTRRDVSTGVVRLLPAWDSYLLGWKGRGLAVPKAHTAEIFPGGGMLFPTVSRDGLAVARWRMKRVQGRVAITLSAFDEPSPSLHERIAAEAEDVGRFLGSDVDLQIG